MNPVTAAIVGLAIIAPQAPEMARIWAADRKDKRARAARERKAAQ